MKQSRDSYLDFLRAFGLILLVVAHTYAPFWLKTIRTFDVPLMVFVSSVCFRPKDTHTINGYLEYVVKRLKRIYIPVCVFLTLYFCLFGCCFLIFGKPQISFSKIIGSYLLLNRSSIGFVWVMKVFLLSAIISPVIYYIVSRINQYGVIVLIIVTILVQNILVGLPIASSSFIFNEYILYITGYAAFVILGISIKSFSTEGLLSVLILSVAAIISTVLFEGTSFDPQLYKYPPHSIYIYYGIAWCTFLWLIKPYIRLGSSAIVNYLSVNSMWIYLWHIIPVVGVSYLSNIHNFWFGRFIIVLSCALILFRLFSICLTVMPDKIAKLIRG